MDRIDWDAMLPTRPADLAEEVGAGEAAALDRAAPDPGIAARERAGDNRRRCAECGNLGERGNCLAAALGQIVASRSYTPIRDTLRRCEGFTPLPTDPDQTPGSVKWAWLRDYSKPKDAT